MPSDEAKVRRAMVLAAGLGARMRPITDYLPKPLIAIGGRTLLDRAIDALAAHGIDQVVVNAHHLAPLIVRHLTGRVVPPVMVTVEEERLETGGGVAKALPLLGEKPFFVVNGDILWRDSPAVASLDDLAAAWDDRRMDALLLLHPLATAIGYNGPGDFLRRNDGTLMRRPQEGTAPYLFAGLQILHPRLFHDCPSGAFSLNVMFDRAIKTDRLCGLIHRGEWCHVGTPADIPPAEAFIREEPTLPGQPTASAATNLGTAA